MRRRGHTSIILRSAVLLLLIAATTYVIDRQPVDKLHPDATTVGLGVILALFVLLLVFPRHVERFADRISAFKLGGLEVGFAQVERANAVERLPTFEEKIQGYGVTPYRLGQGQGQL
jgi:Zn-dependent protease with chaperone function